LPEGAWLYLWARTPAGETATHWTQNWAEAAKIAERLGATADVYCPVAFSDRKGASTQRMIAEASADPKQTSPIASGRIAFVADLDFRNDKHPGNPVDQAGALALAEAFPLRPTIIVNSGRGLHLWWVLTSPWAFADEDDRARCARIAEGWQRRLERIAAEHGAGLDSVPDLPRVLRVPGTVNHPAPKKIGGPFTVELVELQPDRRYTIADFEAVAGDAEPKATTPKPPARPATILGLSDADLRDKAFEKNPAIKRLWEGDTTGYPSHSEADLALLSHLAWWTDFDAERTDRMFRASGLYREDKWGARPDYREDTIAKAFEGKRPGDGYSPPRERGGPVRATSAVKTAATDGGVPVTTETEAAAEEAVGEAVEAVGSGEFDETAGERPVVKLHADLKEQTDSTWEAILTCNGVAPTLFRRGGLAVRVERDDDGSAMIRDVGPDRLRQFLGDRIGWEKWVEQPSKGEGKAGWKATKPPLDLVRNVLATPDLPLPVLCRVVEVPHFAADGTLQVEPGYHSATRTFYAPSPGFKVDPIPETPSQGEIGWAQAIILHEMLADFPFVTPSDKAHAIALLLLPFVRDMVEGATPLHDIEAPCPGTGKDLLADVLLYPSLGRFPTPVTEGRDEDEWRKRITSNLRGGPSVFFLDNVQRRLSSSALSAAVSNTFWGDRILGLSEDTRLPIRCTWVMTANNPTFSSELVRRTVRIRIDAKEDRPWKREGFRIPELREWVRLRRSDLVRAALILVQTWIVNGRPRPPSVIRLGGFERWAEVMAGILHAAGIPDFLANADVFYDVADTEGDQWRLLVAVWAKSDALGKGDRAVSASEVFGLVKSGEVEGDFRLGEGTDRGQATRFGVALQRMKDRRFDIVIPEEKDTKDTVTAAEERFSRRIVDVGKRHGAQLWRLVDPNPKG